MFCRGTLIGRQSAYGSSSGLRESRSFCAQGSSGSVSGPRPPSRSMSPIGPPPTHGPVRSTLPSGRRGTGLTASLSATIGVRGRMNVTCSCAWPGSAAGATAASSPTDRRRALLYTVLLVRLRWCEAAGDAVLVVLETDELHQIEVRPDVRGRESQIDRTRKRSRIIQCELIDERPEVESCEALDCVQLVGMRRAATVEPEPVVVSDSVDDERVVLEPAD